MKKVVELIILLVGVLFVSCMKEIKFSPKVEIEEIKVTDTRTYCVLKVTDSKKSQLKTIGVCINTNTQNTQYNYRDPFRGNCQYHVYVTPGNNEEKIVVDITGRISGTTDIKPYVEKKSGALVYGETRQVRIVDGLKIESIGATSVRLSAVAHGTFYEYGFCYSTSQDPTLSQAHLACGSNGGGSYEGVITGLSRGRTYYVRGYVIQRNGSGTFVSYSDEISFYMNY